MDTIRWSLSSVSELEEIIILTAIAAVVVLLFVPNVGIASAQQHQLTSIPAVIQNGTFENIADGFRMHVPYGWVVQDIDNLHLPNFRVANEAGFLMVAIICPQQEAVPVARGMYNCEQSENAVEVLHDRLSHRPEFETIEDPANNITSDDFLAFIIEEMQGRNYTNIQIINSTDLTINITSPEDSNATIRTAEAKLVEMTYQPSTLDLGDMRSYSILATIPENPQPGLRQIVSGEFVTYEGPAVAIPSGGPPPAVLQMFQSLEFIR